MRKTKIFIENFFNPLITGMWVILLYQICQYKRYQSYNYIIDIIVLGLILFVWLLTSLILAFQNYSVQSKLCHIKYASIIGVIIVIGSSCILGFQSYQHYNDQHFYDNKPSDYVLNDGHFQTEIINKIEEEIQEIIPDNAQAYVCPYTYFVCNESGVLDAFEIEIYFEKDDNAYVLGSRYKKGENVKNRFMKIDYMEGSEYLPQMSDLVKSIYNINLPNKTCKIQMESTNDEAYFNYEFYPINYNYKLVIL